MPRVGVSSSNSTYDVNKRGGGTSNSYSNLFYDILRIPQSGWVTRIGVLAWSASTPLARVRLGLWNPQEQLVGSSGTFDIGSSTLFREANISAVAAAANSDMRVGIWANPNFGEGFVGAQTPGSALYLQQEQSTFPSSLGAAYTGQRGELSAFFEYVANAAPNAPGFFSPASGALISSTTATISTNLPHPVADSAYDSSTHVQIMVFDAETNQTVYNQTLTVTQTENANNRIDRQVSGLTSGRSYYVRVRHRDTWGVWSAFSADRSFSIAQVPDAPELLEPLVKLNQRSGYDYRMTHNHPEGRPVDAVEVELYNAAGSTRLWTSGVRILPSQVASGATFSTPASGGTTAHPTLSWGTGYSWRVRVRDTLGAWSNWTARAAFSTNATPTAPTGLIPVNNARTGNRNFSAAVSDPDGDAITAAQIELVRVSTGAMVSGYPRAMEISGGRATYTVPEADLIAGEQYRFRVRATDGLDSGYGPWSAYSQFTWAIAPTVALLTPSQSGRINMVAQPSAEFDPAQVGSWWTVSGESAANYIVREQSQDSVFGSWRWRGVRADEGGPVPVMRSPLLPVDSAERYLYQLEAKRVLPEPVPDQDPPPLAPLTSSLRIACHDSSGALISEVSPASIRPLSGSEPNPYWTRYGGAVWPASQSGGWPAGTTQVRLIFTPVASGTGEVAFDAASFEFMPDSVSGPGGAGGHFSDSSFFGYADPSTPGYGAPGHTSGMWMGTAGNSESNVISVLWEPATNHVMYSYSHPSNTALFATRVIVQRYELAGTRGRGWRPHHDSGYMTPAATPTVSLPDYLFRNEARYRVKVICRDSGQIDGESEWVEFVARFTGPPELPVFGYQSDANRGTITVSFESTGLPEAEFGGIEVARSADDEPMKIVAVVRDPGASQYTYHFPVSGKSYRFHVRQVRLVGPERVEGRWRSIDASVSYEGFNFLKNAHNPAEYVIFQHTSGAGPNQAREAEGGAYTPWGSESAVHLFSEARNRSDTTAFILFPHHPQSPEDRLRILKEWERARPPLCLLVQLPEPEKIFLALTGAMRFPVEGRLRRAEFEWQQTSFAEPDAYDLEGAVDDLRQSDLGQAM
jgi:hypothetical protein